MSSSAAALAKASYQRCQEIPGFFEAFYERFFAACPAARPMFAKTDFTRQHKVLRHAIGLLLAYDEQAPGPNLLSRLAERHGRTDLKVDPSHFDVFVESLIQTVGAFDPQFTADTEFAWREATARGVGYMKSKA
ncbi:MAG TPA: globin domain-containing protein [Gemmatimonadales bacterium]|nr:globin domain-containing protein [Gemmatimonadales bacterium]